MLNQEQQRRALTIFENALEQLPATRLAWVTGQCANDSELKQQVLNLLAAEERSAADALRTGRFIPSETAKAPERVGHYRIIDQLGAGGMGVVYRGERDDGTFSRTVAIKFIHEIGVGSKVVARFDSERQILARMQHPNIAQMLDGGDVDGRPYLVMEYIEGTPFGYDAKVPRREQLNRFCSVCDALSYAHSQLVLHRDIKPGNILVTEAGTPKLLDFGIAKINNELTAAEPDLTGALGMPVTPNYCPPEYLAGGSASIAGEVYSMGVLLHELLVGQTPHDLSGLSLPEAFSAVTATGAGAAATGVKDLDLILNKALHRDPQRRYLSVEALRGDVEHFLGNRPISARRDDLGYTLRQFVKRNKTLVVAGLVSITLLIGSAVTTALAYLESESSRAIAEQQTQTAEQVLEFFLSAMAAANPIANIENNDVDADPTIAEALDFAESNMLEQFNEEPALLSIIQSTMASIYTSQGKTDKAIHYADLVDARLDAGLIESDYWRMRVRLELANVYAFGNRFKQAIEHARLLDQALRALPEPEWLAVANNLGSLAIALQSDGQTDAAIATHQETLRLGALHDEIPAVARARAENGLAGAYYNRHDLTRAEQHIARGIELMTEAGLGDTVNGLRTKHNWATLLGELGRFDEAKQVFEVSIPALETLIGPAHQMFIWDLTNYGRIFQMAGQPEQVVNLLEPYLKIIDEQRPADDESSAYLISKLAHAMCSSQRPADGYTLAQRATQSASTIYPEGHAFRAEAQVLLGTCLMALNRLDEAAAALLVGKDLYGQAFGSGHRTVVKTQELIDKLNRMRSDAAP